MIGDVGKLSIKIPWKKLGWDPIVIIFQVVSGFTSQQDDKEVIEKIYIYIYIFAKLIEHVLVFDNWKLWE